MHVLFTEPGGDSHFPHTLAEVWEFKCRDRQIGGTGRNPGTDRRRKGSLHRELEAPLGSSGRGDGGRRGRDIQLRGGWGLQGCHALRAGVDQGKGREGRGPKADSSVTRGASLVSGSLV